MARAVAVRIIGFASTPRGFGFAVTEGPRRLVKWNLHRSTVSRAVMVEKVGTVLRRYRPLFVAFETRNQEHGRRGQTFATAVEDACRKHGIMTLPIQRQQLRSFSCLPRPTKWHVGKAMGELFPEVRGQLPPRRKRWAREDDRMGLFMALAAAVAAWEGFRTGQG